MNLIKQICRYHHALPALLCMGIATPVLSGEPAPATPPPAPVEQVFAMVNGKPISAQEYNARYNAILRQRFYHGAPPESQAEAVRKEVADLLIERALLVEEAEKRGIQPDAAKVENAVAAAEARYAVMPEWQQRREVMLPRIREQATRQSLFEQFEKAIRDVPIPAPAEVRAYYEQNPGLFTEPEKLSLSVITRGVDPAAPREDWIKAREEVQKILLDIKGGASFAEQARQHSTAPSATNGGALGYVHGGMLSEQMQAQIDKFQVGEITEPAAMLEGVSIYKLDDRVPAKLRDFAEVAQRAQGLLQRERSERAWKETNSRLREAAKIEILIPLGGSADSGNKP